VTPIISVPVTRLPIPLLTMTGLRHSSSGSIGSAIRLSWRTRTMPATTKIAANPASVTRSSVVPCSTSISMAIASMSSSEP
jgi:hypothetical protein